MIPKKIHFIWLGGGGRDRLSTLCVNSWRRVLYGYQVVEWNEGDLRLDELAGRNRFLKRCLELRLWAFASDYLRLYVLFHEGGIYLDTDVEVVRPFDALLGNKMFVGLEDNGYIGTGVIGAEKGNPTIGRLLRFYEREIWDVDFINNPIIFRYLRDREPDAFEGCEVLPRECFSPYSPELSADGVIGTSGTYAIHWYSGNWNVSRKGLVFMRTKHLRGARHPIGVLRADASYLRNRLIGD